MCRMCRMRLGLPVQEKPRQVLEEMLCQSSVLETQKNQQMFTPPKFNIAPEKWSLEDYFAFWKVTLQGLC